MFRPWRQFPLFAPVFPLLTTGRKTETGGDNGGGGETCFSCVGGPSGGGHGDVDATGCGDVDRRFNNRSLCGKFQKIPPPPVSTLSVFSPGRQKSKKRNEAGTRCGKSPLKRRTRKMRCCPVLFRSLGVIVRFSPLVFLCFYRPVKKNTERVWGPRSRARVSFGTPQSLRRLLGCAPRSAWAVSVRRRKGL